MIERYCKGCPNLIKTGKDEKSRRYYSATGKAYDRTLGDFSFYCQYAPEHYKKIAGIADWTGRVPKWCPRRNDEEVAE